MHFIAYGVHSDWPDFSKLCDLNNLSLSLEQFLTALSANTMIMQEPC